MFLCSLRSMIRSFRERVLDKVKGSQRIVRYMQFSSTSLTIDMSWYLNTIALQTERLRVSSLCKQARGLVEFPLARERSATRTERVFGLQFLRDDNVQGQRCVCRDAKRGVQARMGLDALSVELPAFSCSTKWAQA